MGRPVLTACQLQPALLGPEVPEAIGQLGGGGLQGGAPLEQGGDLRGRGERQAAQALQPGMPLPQGQQGPVQVTGQPLHLAVQLLLLEAGIAQVAGRGQGRGQGRGGWVTGRSARSASIPWSSLWRARIVSSALARVWARAS